LNLIGFAEAFFSEPLGSLDCGAPAPLLNFKAELTLTNLKAQEGLRTPKMLCINNLKT
jgi:hypothetical protein